MSTIEVNKITPVDGTTATTLGDSGDTFTVPTGAGLTVTDEVKTNKISPASGTTFTLGDSGDTFNIPSGATIANAGTATGFGVAGTVLFQATGTSSQTGLADNTSTKRNFVSEIFDTASAYDTSNSRFTVPSGQDGKYLISANVNMEATSAGKVINSELQIRVDGTSVRNTLFKTDFNEFDRFDMNATTILNLSAGDYVEIYGNINTDNGSDWNMYSGANTNVFTGFRIA